MKKNKIFISIMIIAAIALGNAGSTLYLPAMPAIAAALHVNSAMMRLSLSLFLIGFGISQLIYGPLSDAFGRKKILTAGIFIFLIGSILSALATDANMLLFGRLIEGLGIGAANAVGYAAMRDVYSGNQLTMQLSYISVFVGAMPLIAPIIGGYLVTTIDWQSCFYILAAVALLLLIIKWLWLPETLLSPNPSACSPKALFKNYRILLCSPLYMGFVLVTAFAYSGIFVMGSSLPFLLVTDLGILPSHYGWIAGIPALGYLVGAFIAGKLASKMALPKLIVIGILLSFFAVALGSFINLGHFTLYSLIGPLIFLMLGVGFLVPIGSSGAMAPFPELAGSESALLCAFMFGFASIFTAIGSHLDILNPMRMFILIGVTLLCSLVSVLMTTKGVKND